MIMLFLLIFFLVTVISLSLLIFQKQHQRHGKLNLPPGPKGVPLIGNLHQFDPSAPHLYLAELAKVYGPILQLWFGRRSVVVIQSATLAKEVMKTHDDIFCSRPLLTGDRKLSYDGLDLGFSPYTDYFREMKKLCVIHLFNSKKVQSSTPIREDEVSRMIQKISSLSAASEVVNLTEMAKGLTCSIICRAALGRRYEDAEGSRFQSLYKDAQAMLTAVFFSDYVPVVGGLIDKLTGLSSRLEKVFKDMDELYEKIINDHLDPHRAKSEHKDFIDVLLQLQREDCFTFELTFNHIKGVLMNIILAGTDTSAAMIVWAMTELIKNPGMMQKVQDEIRTLAGDKGFINESDLPKFPYLKAVVKETLRIHPASPLLIPREVTEKCRLQGYDILPGSLVFVNAWAIARDPIVWSNPQVFMPERFVGSSVDIKGQNFEMVPFGAGKRMCPGMHIGVLNVELTLANLLYTFNWELLPGMKEEDVNTDVIPGITMHKRIPLCLVPKKSHIK